MTAASTLLLTDERCFWHAGKSHALIFPVGGWVQPPSGSDYAESPDSKRRLKSLLDVSGLTAQLDVSSAAMASDEDLRRVHPASYLARFAELSAGEGGEVGFEASFGPGGYDIARISAGLAVEAVSRVAAGTLRNAYALTRPPGHHCLPDSGLGFCLLANIAIAVERAIAEHKLTRVAVIDWDVHHGNGTEEIFVEDPDVYYVSLHQERIYPFTGLAQQRGHGKGEGYTLNLPLPAASDGEVALKVWDERITPALDAFQPEFLLVSAGFDARENDPIGGLKWKDETFVAMTHRCVKLAEKHCKGRIVSMLEGGYYPPGLASASVAHVKALGDIVPP
jgi:acetoin utilization deacetylase AcuC-like enzyme